MNLDTILFGSTSAAIAPLLIKNLFSRLDCIIPKYPNTYYLMRRYGECIEWLCKSNNQQLDEILLKDIKKYKRRISVLENMKRLGFTRYSYAWIAFVPFVLMYLLTGCIGHQVLNIFSFIGMLTSEVCALLEQEARGFILLHQNKLLMKA